MAPLLTRRRFFGKAIRLSSACALSPVLGPFFRQEAEAQRGILAVVEGNPADAVRKAIDVLGGIETFIHPGDTVLIKPNVSFPNPKEWATTTSPEVVYAVVQSVLEAGAGRVIIADNTMRKNDICFVRTGLMDAFEGMENVKIIPIQRESFFTEKTVPGGRALQSVKVAKLLDRCNVFINLPCAKSHAATQVSFGLKNAMGLIWDRAYFHQGTDVHEAIAELATVIRPHLTILDATRALTTAGPTGPGKVVELNTILAGTDPLAVDAYAASMIPWNNRTLKAGGIAHLKHAYRLGVGEINTDRVEIRKLQV